MSLKNLLALQAQKKAADAAKPAEAKVNPLAALTKSASTESKSGEVSTQQEPPKTEPAKPKGLGLNLLSAAKASTALVVTPKVPVVEADEVVFSLEDLAGMDETATPARRVTEHSGFADEIEATAPDRELPEDLTTQQLSFVEQLDGIYGILHDPEMFAQSVRIVMMELQENPEYIKLVSDPDVHTMIRGMRNNMGLARIKKQEKSRKAGTGTKTRAKKVSAETDMALALLNSLGGDDD